MSIGGGYREGVTFFGSDAEATRRFIIATVSAELVSLLAAAGVTGGGTEEIVTSLPSTPTDGQTVAFLADATNGVVWRFRFRSASASLYKWEFVGGGWLWSEVATAEATAASIAYQALATVGPSVTVPLNGDYDIRVASSTTTGASNQEVFHSYDIGGTGAVDADAARGPHTASNVGAPGVRIRRKLGLTAGTALVSKYKPSTATATTFLNRSLAALPVRVG